jgi:tripartite-type tricarboxylate transporter receptor subunit TctC
MPTLQNLTRAIFGACLALVHAVALAQGAAGYPGRMIKLVVPFPAGGATDIMARNIAQKLNEAWKQPVVVENRPGANGTIGADAVAKSPADGYTYLVATIAHSANVTLFPNTPYQLQRDLQAVAILGLIPMVPVVHPSLPVRNLKELVAISKKQSLNGGSGGNGTAAHLTLELFKSVTGAKIQHIPYKGGAPAMTDLVGGQIEVIFSLLPECLPYVKSGKIRGLAVTTDKRYSLLPDIPTTSESGIPGLEVTSWNGLMAPTGTPGDIVTKLNAEVVRITGMPDMNARITELGYQTSAMSVGDADKYIKADIERWRKVIRAANIRAD